MILILLWKLFAFDMVRFTHPDTGTITIIIVIITTTYTTGITIVVTMLTQVMGVEAAPTERVPVVPRTVQIRVLRTAGPTRCTAFR